MAVQAEACIVSAVVRALERKADPEVVDYLETVLERARRGETSGVLILEQRGDSCSWCCSGLGDRFKIIGYLAHAIHKMQGDD